VGTRRLGELDSLRGIASVIVLLHHNFLSAGLLTGRFREVLVASPLRAIDNGRPAVLFFFVLSGFVLTRALRATGAVLTARDYALWVLQRTARLCLPATAALAVSAMFYALISRGVWPGEAKWLAVTVWTRPPTPSSFMAQALLLALDGGYYLDNVLWSLVHEWRISLVLPVVATAAAFRGKNGARLLVLLGIAFGSVFGGPWGGSFGLGPTFAISLRATLYFLLPFLIGAALESGDIAEVRGDRWQVAAGAIAVLGLGRVDNDYSTFVASALLIWLALQPGLIQRVLRQRAFVWLGTISFSLYLIHEPVLALLFNGLHDRLPPAAICALSLTAALPAAYVFYLLVERPTHRLARLIGRRRLPSARLAQASG
jgi:peptidoglycan/LPS O-acetylase OafA/YrhL